MRHCIKPKIFIFDFNIVPEILSGYSLLSQLKYHDFDKLDIVVILNRECDLTIELEKLKVKYKIITYGRQTIIENYTRLEMIRSLIGLILNIILNLLLMPVYGINGAAIATLITMLFTSNILFLFNRKTRDLFFLQNKSLFNFKIAINSLKS